MTSDRKITANRNNAKKSTGPRTTAGRDAARRNARSHGLAVAIGGDPVFHEDIEALAKLLAESAGMKSVSEFARSAAEASIDLLRIRKFRTRLLQSHQGPDTAAPDRLTELNGKLAKLERYERRAYSRRNRALRGL
jgi:hypothetical protein